MAIDLSATKQEQKEPAHNMAVVHVIREDSDPLVCPEMTAPQMIIAPPRFAGGPPQRMIETVLMACIGKHCAKWSHTRQACGAVAKL